MNNQTRSSQDKHVRSHKGSRITGGFPFQHVYTESWYKKNVYEYMCMLQGLVEMINHESKYRQVCMFACVYEEYITWARCIFEQRLPRYMSMYECMWLFCNETWAYYVVSGSGDDGAKRFCSAANSVPLGSNYSCRQHICTRTPAGQNSSRDGTKDIGGECAHSSHYL